MFVFLLIEDLPSSTCPACVVSSSSPAVMDCWLGSEARDDSR
ncbi:unnamed protein product [Timema podura]|uniref:Uncharacterized protein n=1 Tax=Timema podura TaxID=61482 RepID=A0ABN7P7W2_TIMPD|nr:unnamed protein product [Timema podura]